ncbi:hypothetical protein [Variovorax sp. Sphag1AA]|uniref:hypothetical protein n=1 Tax=Variovorax sp. Sphag1AA TaxID=2587027 RepID=UPI00161D58C1|nr:hypothetical protein [Variovorax sp. Sphag1AA]MBB3177222.1 hypothetical protein [Variovorax sp. Sphag1AA]
MLALLLRVWPVILIFLALAGCAGMTSPQPKFAFHSFSYDGWAGYDNWEATADLLEYSYGDQYRMVRRKVEPPRTRLNPQSGVGGFMPVGEFLYVKWRVKATGEIVDDRVDLRPLLPKDMTKHELTFVIEGRQLYVYLVTPTPKGVKDPPILKTYLSWFNVTYEIYPINTREGVDP